MRSSQILFLLVTLACIAPVAAGAQPGGGPRVQAVVQPGPHIDARIGFPEGPQARPYRSIDRPPLRLAITLPAGRPPVSTGTLLRQTGVGILGGVLGLAAIGFPVMLAAWDGSFNENLTLVLMGSGYLGGTVAGVHYAGRAHGMRGNPWATAGGVLAGLTLAGASMQPFIDEEGEAGGPGPLLVFILPGVGGTAGYALTRAER